MNLIQWDKNMLLSLNSHHSEFWDSFMWMATDEMSWLVLFAALLYVLFKAKGKEFFFILIAVALTVVICDQVSGIFKDWIARPRPAREPDIMHSVHVVNDYRGGKYGFFSSHAANTFGIAVLVILLLRNWLVTSVMLLWALIESYSRIYLGVHYPLDIMTGIVFGALTGLGVYMLYSYILKKFYVKPSSGRNVPYGMVLLSFIITLFMMMMGSNTVNDFLL